MKSGQSYSVKINGISLNGDVQPEITKEFTVPTVEEQWDLNITLKNSKGEEITNLEGNGVSTATVSFELKDKATGLVDKNANDVVLFVSATRGKLSQERITIQNGKADMLIQSEFFADIVDAKIDAQVIEASRDYSELIGKVVGSKTIQLVPEGYTDAPTTVVSIVGANSNEADRVTVTFDGDVKASDFYYTQDIGANNVGDIKTDVVKVSQSGDATSREIVGVLLDAANPKKAVFILDKADTLTDNKDVKVSAKIGDRATEKTVNFKLTDARKPNLTSARSIGSNNELILKFSEPIHEATFVLDGRFEGSELGNNATDTFKVTYGEVEFDQEAVKFVDNRNTVKLVLNGNYQELDKNTAGDFIYPAGYFKPGTHSVEASDIYDFAAKGPNGDANNIGSTQVLEFEIDEVKGEAQVIKNIDSPEQFRVSFDRPVAFKTADTNANSSFAAQYKFEVYNEATSEWVKADGAYFTDSTVDASDLIKVTTQTVGKDTVYKLELKHDWTKVYDTENTKNNFYNDKFRIVLPKNTVVNSSNGKANVEDIVIDMSTGTALSRPDIISPKISSMKPTRTPGQFEVIMTEPVKLEGKLDTSTDSTLAQGQTQLPTTLVEFLGKDKKGKTVTFIGKLDGYAEVNTDKAINVSWTANTAGETPQTIVNDGGSTEWTLVVKAISDDVGNVTATDSQTFTLKGSEVVAGDFMVNPTIGSAIGDNGVDNTFAVKGTLTAGASDEVEVTFTEDVSVTGLGSATNVSNYTLNGAKLPTGSSIILAGADNKTITIKLPEGTLDASSNVLILGEQLVSAKGNILKGDVSFTFDAMSQADRDAAALQAAIDAVNSADATNVIARLTTLAGLSADLDVATIIAGNAAAYVADFATNSTTTAAEIQGRVTAVNTIQATTGVVLGSTTETTKGVEEVAEVGTMTVTTKSTTSETKNIIISDGTVNETISVTLADNTSGDVNDTATAIRDAISGNTNVTDAYTVGGTGADIVLTQKSPTSDVTINVDFSAATTAVLDSNSSAHDVTETTKGVEEVKEVGTTVVTDGATRAGNITVNVSDGTINEDITVAVAAGDSAADVAGKIRTALGLNSTVTGAYTVGGTTTDIVLTQTGAGSDVALSVTLK